MTDYIIVGAGLAGLAFAQTALKHDKSIVVFENDSQHSSQTAAGVYNPVILKRFSSLQDAQQQLDSVREFYTDIASRIGKKYNIDMPILRRFASVEEQNNWFIASEKDGLSPFLSTKLVRDKFPGIDSPFDFGLVQQTGFVDTQAFLADFRQFLKACGFYREQSFDYSRLDQKDGFVQFGDVQARHVVFCEGFGIKSNPYFNYLPLEGTKGEVIVIKAALDIEAIVKGGVFILPIGGGTYKVGATYEWHDKTEIPSESGKQELIEKLKEIVSVDFEIIDHRAGIRPTVKDRKPMVGTHPTYPNLHILNGLGTRGVMLGPTMAKLLYENIENGAQIPSNVNITRFPRIA
ncbi:NAD(P)/FAD-dependent oxidoreductase [Flavobacterium selenitireducens]|uniref:NAD(P)/FAD-dependent oxidoreductase n=1 Tax=Flavobacterium selenitireducens TaxID=2722704 RepID=UPI00168BE5C3|nr:FAD-binding oxidoreductase [Flavobacterium selenitireducens]MBD3583330.1 FAD-binding oxidoreductase [Flavobacterium selenitireducens]